MLVDAIEFHGDRIQKTCIAGDVKLLTKVMPEGITEYPICL